MFYDCWVATWHDTQPCAVWILRRGMTPLPAWPGLLIAWKRTDPQPPKPAAWMGLVAIVRAGSQMELKWFYESDLQKVTEEPPICGG